MEIEQVCGEFHLVVTATRETVGVYRSWLQARAAASAFSHIGATESGIAASVEAFLCRESRCACGAG